MSTENERRVLDTLRACAGAETTSHAALDSSFAALGVDSLARLELGSRLQSAVRVQVDDDLVRASTTPRQLASALDLLLAEAGARAGGADLRAGAEEVGTAADVGGPATTDASVVVAAPFDLTWTMTNDVRGWVSLFDEYSRVEILDETGSTTRFRLTLKPDPSGQEWSWISERTLDKSSRTVTARRVESGWFEHMRIRWDYEDVAEGTSMRWRQWFTMRSDSPVDQATMVARITHGSAVQLTRIRGLVEAAARPAGLGVAR